jgi:hypothetical protein
MAHSISSSTPSDTPGAGQPSELTRTVVSFLVFIHLFALVVGITSNEVPSQLESELGQLKGLRQYRQALGMDLPYTYYFTRGNDPGGELDIDYTIEATIKRADGSTETVKFPDAEMSPHQRFHRYQKLATRLAEFAADDAEPLNFLAQSIAGGLLRSHDAKSLDLRCRGQLTPPAMADFQPDAKRDPGVRDAYDAHAFLSGDKVELLKKESARDTAPPPKDQ